MGHIAYLTFAVLATYCVHYGSTFDCSYNGMKSRTDGCSVPFNLRVPYIKTFIPACVKHDLCYYCKWRQGWRRLSCDNAFLKDMKAICKKKYGKKRRRREIEYELNDESDEINYDELAEFSDPNPRPFWSGRRRSGRRRWIRRIVRGTQHTACIASAVTYYGAVRAGGGFFEINYSPGFCSHSCVTTFGNPSSTISVGF